MSSFGQPQAGQPSDWLERAKSLGPSSGSGGSPRAIATTLSTRDSPIVSSHADRRAAELGTTVHRIDLKRIASRYIGEPERNIDRAFGEAERAGAVLLIDEADALLGKRTDVKDAHDRYANTEVSYLLERIEAYNGVALLATNAGTNIDPAFSRRIRRVIDLTPR